MATPHEVTGSVTEALRATARGDRGAADRLLELIYDDLRRLAHQKRGGLGPAQTIQTTALVHEAWLRVSESERSDWSNRSHFFGAAARAMRNILVDQARRKAALKRGGAHGRVDALDEADGAIESPVADVLALDESLEYLQQIEPRKAEVVSLRFFTGLSMEAVADVLGVSLTTVESDWRFARSWLQARIEQGRTR